jgi:hypothetical protein
LPDIDGGVYDSGVAIAPVVAAQRDLATWILRDLISVRAGENPQDPDEAKPSQWLFKAC